MNYLKQQDGENHPLGMVLERWLAQRALTVWVS